MGLSNITMVMKDRKVAFFAVLALLLGFSFLVFANIDPAGAAPAKPKVGKWKVKKDSGNYTKGGSFRVYSKSKKLKRFTAKPKGNVIDYCGSSKPIRLVGSVPIKKKLDQWRVSNAAGTHGRTVKLKQGGKRYTGYIFMSFTNSRSGTGLVATGVGGCYMYFNIKR